MSRFTERVYRFLLLAYPEPYRRAHADELVGFVRESLADRAEGSMVAKLSMWARVFFDAVTQGIAERIRRVRDRDRRPNHNRGPGWMRDLAADLRYAVRALRRSPGFAASLILTMGLGIGANTAIFEVVDAAMLEPLPYQEPERLVDVYQDFDNFTVPSLPFDDAVVWQEQHEVFSSVSINSRRSFVRTGGDEPVTIQTSAVTPGILQTLGQDVALGRGFTESDAVPGAEPVTIITDEAWRTYFGADPSVLGTEVVLDDRTFVIVGVLPKGVKFPRGGKLWGWVPISSDGTVLSSPLRRVSVLGRLAEGMDLSLAQERAEAISAGLAENGSSTKVRLVNHASFRVNPDVRRDLYFLSGAVILLFAISMANAISLLLSRGVTRAREIAVRAAIGASRGRLARQVFAESFLLAVLSSIFAVGLAFYATDAVVAVLPRELVFFSATPVEFDSRVGVFVFAMTLVTTLGLGSLAALGLPRLTRSGLGVSGSRTHTPGGKGLRAGLVVMEVGTATTLWIGCALMITSFANLLSVDPGFETADLVFVELDLSQKRYPDPRSREAVVTALTERLEALPGVDRISTSIGLPPRAGFMFGTQIQAENQAVLAAQPTLLPWVSVEPGFFATLGIPLLRGRDFETSDTASAIIDRDLARALWGENDPVGRRFRTDADDEWVTVIGVAGDVKLMGQDDRRGKYEVYTLRGLPGMRANISVAIRTGLSLDEIAPLIKSAVRDLDPAQPVQSIRTATSAMAASVDKPRFLLILMGVFAVVALMLTAVGVYGVLSFSVNQRRREIGVRMALGARAASVLRLIVRDGMNLATLGVLLGVAGGLAGSKLVESLLFGVAPRDPFSFVLAATLLSGTALAACYLPARRAARVDPVQVLKEE